MTAISKELHAWVETLLGTRIAQVDEMVGGSSRQSFVVTDENGDKSFLRVDAGTSPLSGTPFTLEREYSVLKFLQDSAVPVARTYGFSAQHNAILMAFVPGFTTYQKTGSDAEERALRRELIAAIVALQRLPSAGLTCFRPSAATTLRAALDEDLKIWNDLYDKRVDPRDPLLEFSLNFLEWALPDPESKPVLVHGDIGPGNFMVEDGRIVALIDWEMVRLGHPLEDLACIIARALGAPFGDASEHVANYEALTGRTVDRAKLDYALILVMTRWMVAISMGLSKPSVQQNVPTLFAFRQINAKAFVEAFCRYFHIESDATEVSFRPHRRSAPVGTYASELLGQFALREDFSAADRHRFWGVAEIVAYLRAVAAYGPEKADQEEFDRICEALGAQFADLESAREAFCDRARSVPMSQAGPIIRCLYWLTAREHEIMRTTLGGRADNTIALPAYPDQERF